MRGRESTHQVRMSDVDTAGCARSVRSWCLHVALARTNVTVCKAEQRDWRAGGRRRRRGGVEGRREAGVEGRREASSAASSRARTHWHATQTYLASSTPCGTLPSPPATSTGRCRGCMPLRSAPSLPTPQSRGIPRSSSPRCSWVLRPASVDVTA